MWYMMTIHISRERKITANIKFNIQTRYWSLCDTETYNIDGKSI